MNQLLIPTGMRPRGGSSYLKGAGGDSSPSRDVTDHLSGGRAKHEPQERKRKLAISLRRERFTGKGEKTPIFGRASCKKALNEKGEETIRKRAWQDCLKIKAYF